MAEQSVTFTIGGEEVQVPALNLYTLELCQKDIDALKPELPFTVYAGHVLNIIVIALDDGRDRAALAKRCSVTEMYELIPKMTDLLRVSGFIAAGEAEAAMESDGTGTSTASPQNSLPTESAVGISSE